MTNEIAVFVDNSGSTAYVDAYWNGLKRIYKQLHEDNRDATFKYFFWNNNCESIKEQHLIRSFNTRNGTGGTNIECIVKNIPKTINKLVIVTDGQVLSSSVHEAETLFHRQGLIDEKFSAEVHMIGKCDLSVAAPFIRNRHFRVVDNEKVVLQGDSGTAFDANEIKTPEEFKDQFENILNVVTATNIGRNNNVLRQDLLKLQSRLLRVLKERVRSDDGTHTRLMNLLDTGNTQQAVNELGALARRYYSGEETQEAREIEARIATLCRICESQDSYIRVSYDPTSLNTSRSARVSSVQDVFLNSQSATPVTEADDPRDIYTDIITLDASVPVLVLQRNHAINGEGDYWSQPALLTNFSKEFVDAVTTNPLLALNNKEFIDKLANSIAPSYGVEYAQAVEEHATSDARHPLTRCEVVAQLSLDSSNEHIAQASSQLMKFLSGGKKLGNVHLWMLVVYIVVVERVPFVRNEPGVFSALKRQLNVRLRHRMTHLGLSGLPQYPMTSVPIGIALYYVLASHYIFRSRDEVDADRLRAFVGRPAHVIATIIADVLGWQFPSTTLLSKDLPMLEACSWLIWQLNKVSTAVDVLHSTHSRLIRHRLQALAGQNFDSFVIPMTSEPYEYPVTLILDGTHGVEDREDLCRQLSLPESFASLDQQDVEWLLFAFDRFRNASLQNLLLKQPGDNVTAYHPVSLYNAQENAHHDTNNAMICPATLRPTLSCWANPGRLRQRSAMAL